MIHLGKSLEALARLIRPLVGPAYRRAYSAMTARGMSQRLPGEPLVCCDFADPKIDAVGGRYYFSLVRDLIDAGYFPVFTEHRATLSTFGPSRMKALLLNERLGTIPSLAALDEPYFLLTDREIPAPPRAERVVMVNYETRLCAAADEMAFPFFVHPQIAADGGLPHDYEVAASRPARLFFGGNTEAGKYDKDLIRNRYHMLSRREMLEIAATAAPVHRPDDAAEWLASAEFHPYVLCETGRCEIPRERWLDALAKADFFLACPGVGMPLCHNLIEAMAAGAVPVLQYADYLPDPLHDRVNCLAFHDAASLRETLREIQSMAPDAIMKLRAGVRDYYEEFLASGALATRLFTGIPRKTLLLNAYRVPRNPGPKQVWIVDEGSQGHVVQSRGLAREIAKLVPIHCHEIQGRLALENKLAKSIVKKALRRWRLKWLFRCTHDLSATPPQKPDLVISSGPRSLSALEYFSKVHGCPSVFLQGTIHVPKGSVDVIMRPNEGESRDDFIFIPLLFNEITEEGIGQAKAAYLESNGREKHAELNALFIGASSPKIRFEPADWDALADFVNRTWKDDGKQWLIATSARTGEELEARLRERIAAEAIYDAVWYCSSPRKITKEFLGLADAVFVTMDSLTMISEAVSSGRPVTAICPNKPGLDLPNTHRRFIEGLARDGVIQLLGAPFAVTKTTVSNGPAVRQLLQKIGWNPSLEIR